MFFVVKKLFIAIKLYLPEILLTVFVLYSRLVGNNWDSGQHLHPDERFLTMVQLALKLPTNFTQYLDPNQSSLSPHNQGYGFYVYGMLPITVNKLIAVFAQTDSYVLATLQGRFLSGIIDCAVVAVLYQLTKTVFPNHQKKRLLALLVSASYGLAVLPIQLAHFFTVDSFLTFGITATILVHARFSRTASLKQLFGGAILFGIALACKINALLLLPLIGFLALLGLWSNITTKYLLAKLLQILGLGLLYIVVVMLTLRLTSPHYFASASILNPLPSTQFIDNLKSLKNYEGPDVWFPPAIQWISKPIVWHSVKNIVLYGYGIGLSSLALIGLLSFVIQNQKHATHRENILAYSILGWGVVITVYQSTQFVQAIRYFIIVYPIFAIMSGLGWLWLSQLSTQKIRQALLHCVVIILLLIWPLAFLGIYHQKHSRVAASEWMHQSLPSYSLVGYEYWDDPLPLSIPGPSKQFVGVSLHVFDQDTFEKWRQLSHQLNQLDYYVLSSNRAWASIIAVPHKYPRMASYYQDLLTNKTEYQLVAEFTNYPNLRYLGIPIEFPTDSADESFTVYDHPKVLIYMNKNTIRPPEIIGYDRAIMK